MWAEVNGERKKVACGPCIRGHRSSKCDHRDRVLVEVRKPGRPLSSCPHPSGSCSCERVVINYTIPKTSECACPSGSSQPVVGNNSTRRVQKPRARKHTATTFNTAVLEKAVKAAQDEQTDSSSLLTRTPTSESSNASNPSSASSTPRLLPLQNDSQPLESIPVGTSASTSPPAASQPQKVSSCCQPKPVQTTTKSCCSNKATEPPEPVPPKKSCCSSSAPAPPTQSHVTQPPIQPNFPQNQAGFAQYPAQFQHSPYGMVHPNSSYMQTPTPLTFNAPIYNHMASGYHPSTSMPMVPINGHATSHPPEHNCHCGDSCSCFGCAAHPRNPTTVEFVRSIHQFMNGGQFGAIPPPNFDFPSYPHQAGYGAEADMMYSLVSPNYLDASHMDFRTNINNAMHMSHAPINVPGTWAHSLAPDLVHNTPSAEPHFFGSDNVPNNLPPINTREPPLPTKVEDSIQSPTVADSPGESKDEDSATLSPSSFFWQEMVLPGCDDATGTCQCGDGCDCVGCLTHGGHNGVQLQLPTSNQQTFPDYVSPTVLNTSASNDFGSPSMAPT